MSVERPFADCAYAWFAHQDSFRIAGPAVTEMGARLLAFSTPGEAVQACYLLHDIYQEGAQAARENIRKAIGV